MRVHPPRHAFSLLRAQEMPGKDGTDEQRLGDQDVKLLLGSLKEATGKYRAGELTEKDNGGKMIELLPLLTIPVCAN